MVILSKQKNKHPAKAKVYIVMNLFQTSMYVLNSIRLHFIEMSTIYISHKPLLKIWWRKKFKLTFFLFLFKIRFWVMNLGAEGSEAEILKINFNMKVKMEQSTRWKNGFNIFTQNLQSRCLVSPIELR